jgi:hypothetical protein
MEAMLQLLNGKQYAVSKISALANAGDWAGAQDMAAQYGVWGLWKSIGEAAGLPCDDDARNRWIAEFKAKRAAKFSKK